jgi:MFS family permease
MLAPMQNELGWSRAQLTGAFSLALLVSGFAAYPVGRTIDLHGARWLMTAGSVFASALVFAWSIVTDLVVFYLIWVGIGIAMGAVLYEPAFAVIATWFDRYRNRALTILTLCAGLASVIFVPLAERLVRGYGWRAALVILAAVTACITIPLHALVLRRAPCNEELVKDNSGQTTEQEIAAEQPCETRIKYSSSKKHPGLREVVKSFAFWQLAAAFCLKTAAGSVIVVHLISYLAERNFTPGFGALVIAAIGGSQLPGRLFFAAASRRFTPRLLLTVLFLLQVLALILLIFAAGSTSVWIFAVLFGVSNGAATPARASLVAERYGRLNYASIAGMIAMVATVAIIPAMLA